MKLGSNVYNDLQPLPVIGLGFWPASRWKKLMILAIWLLGASILIWGVTRSGYSFRVSGIAGAIIIFVVATLCMLSYGYVENCVPKNLDFMDEADVESDEMVDRSELLTQISVPDLDRQPTNEKEGDGVNA